MTKLKYRLYHCRLRLPKLYRVLQYLFPRSCYKIELEVHSIYSSLGVEIIGVHTRLPDKFPEGMNRAVEDPSVFVKAIVHEHWRVDPKDYSQLYSRKQMRKRF